VNEDAPDTLGSENEKKKGMQFMTKEKETHAN